MKEDYSAGKGLRLARCTHSFDDNGIHHVRWDNGSTLGLVPAKDLWEQV